MYVKVEFLSSGDVAAVDVAPEDTISVLKEKIAGLDGCAPAGAPACVELWKRGAKVEEADSDPVQALGLESGDTVSVRLPGLRAPCVYSGHTGFVNSVACAETGGKAYSASSDGTTKVWDTASGQCVRTLLDCTRVLAVAVSACGKLVYTGTVPGTSTTASYEASRIKVWETTGWTHVAILKGPMYNVDVDDMFLSAAADRLWVMAKDTGAVWDTANWERSVVAGAYMDDVCSLAISPDGRRAYTAWKAGGELRVFGDAGECVTTLDDAAARCLVATRCGGRLYAYDGEAVRVRSTETWEVLRSLEDHPDGITAMALSPCDKFLYTVGLCSVVTVRDVDTGARLGDYRALAGDSVRGVWPTPCGTCALVAGGFNTVHVWDSLPSHLFETHAAAKVVEEVGSSGDGGGDAQPPLEGRLKALSAAELEAIAVRCFGTAHRGGEKTKETVIQHLLRNHWWTGGGGGELELAIRQVEQRPQQ